MSMESSVLAAEATPPRCPICGGEEFVEVRGRPADRCRKCRALTRTRTAWLVLTEVCRVGPGTRLLHFAPEPALAPRLHAICGEGYAPYDLNNERYSYPFPVGHCNLCTDVPRMFEPGSFDVVMHNHVLEHLPCNYTIVLQRLHALLRPGGYHVFSFPIGSKGYYRSDMTPDLPEHERRRRFGQGDHIRRFTRNDFEQTVGMVFGLTGDYSLTDYIPAATLSAAAIPPPRWTLEQGPVFIVRA
jgi:phosphoglycolate phosphatase